MWITFKSCIFAFWNNNSKKKPMLLLVVNYIQILYLCILKQRICFSNVGEDGCELHSNLVSLHSETTWFTTPNRGDMLWITFKSCIFAFWNNEAKHTPDKFIVVNYIQILYLCILKQQSWEKISTTLVVNYIQILYLCILKQHHLP